MKKQSGFTLIELLVVIAIIALIASFILVALDSSRKKTRNAKRVADMSQIAKALELYYSKCNSFPVSIAGGGVGTVTLTSLLTLYGGTIPECGNNRGTPGNGGMNSATGATITGTVLGYFQTAPTPPDTDLCATLHPLTSVAFNSYQYRSYADAALTTPSGTGGDSAQDANGYAITFCLGDNTGDLQAGVRTLTPTGFR